jgi:phosphoribosylaminoimidazolecarboxamide formyltransferase/IMP cyclohydrolase
LPSNIKRALLSVTDKADLVDFARELNRYGVQLIASGGTAKAIRAADIPATEVSGITGFPEIFDGRVKTMHPTITGGILMRRDNEIDQKEAEAHRIKPIDLVVVNLYRFREAVAQGLSPEQIVEQIDIGGPTLIRSAAKNFKDVVIVVEPVDYPRVLEFLGSGEDVPLATRWIFARKAFQMTRDYDSAIAEWFETVVTRTR